MKEAVREITGFGLEVARAGQVLDAERTAQLLQLRAPVQRGSGDGRIRRLDLLIRAAVVEEVDGELVLRVVHGFRRRKSDRQQGRILVVGRHENVNGGSILRGDAGSLRPLDRARDDEEAQSQHQDAEHLRAIEHGAGDEIDHAVDARERRGRAPVGVPEDEERPDGEEQMPPVPLQIRQLDGKHDQQACTCKRPLGCCANWL